VSFAHLRTRRRLALLASGVLEAEERERALLHVAGCPRCAGELGGLRAALEHVASDPARSAEPPLDMDTLVRLTQARIDRSSAAPEPARRRPVPLWAPLAAAAALAAIALAIRLAPPAVESSRAVAAQEVSWPDESLRRLERTVEREQAARYLSEAEAVLVTVAATPQRCDRNRTTVDMAQERRRSRELLARGALLVDFDSEEIRSVRPVLEDVERVLRQVATLDACARPEDLIAIHEELRERRLLMKIDLMTRELLG
jgi:hypothetical protein